MITTDTPADAFIQRWQGKDGSEKANLQFFLGELCELLGVEKPQPAQADNKLNAYVFERRIDLLKVDHSSNTGFIDLYCRDCFVLEGKSTGKKYGSTGLDTAMIRAHRQAKNYIENLPATEKKPPFMILTDVGHVLELYAEFSCSNSTYTQFPDSSSYRIKLDDLRKPDIRARLAAVWTDPHSLDESKKAAKVTKQIATQLAALAKSLEAAHAAETVGTFLMRCLFTMFAEDVELLPKDRFTHLLEKMLDKPERFKAAVENLWLMMDKGGYDNSEYVEIKRFNGGLFAGATALALDKAQIELLLKAAKADWRYVEPAIFGTLLERALNPKERHKLGAHYTPRAYVERLVLPTVLAPLRQQWADVQTAATVLLAEYQKSLEKAEKASQRIVLPVVNDESAPTSLELSGQRKVKKTKKVLTADESFKKAAIDEVRAFHAHLCSLRILDPACGSGNFLYVTLEHLKRLEGEVLNTLQALGFSPRTLEMEGVSVSPQQFLGLEVNPRAAAIAEMVLWIGYLQWHFRTHGNVSPAEPILRDFHNIENRDAVLAYDGVENVLDAAGNPVTRWDGRTVKTHPVTGKDVPDETAQVPVLRYLKPRKAEWPAADYIIGNPPFIGNKRMRELLGDGYVNPLRTAWTDVPDSVDFVMYWWHKAAEATRSGKTQRFGFITTNSLRQTFNRKVLQHHLEAQNPVSLIFAIPDHPWVDNEDGAAVRIAMTACAAGDWTGQLQQVTLETDTGEDEVQVELSTQTGKLFSDLRIGANIAAAKQLVANSALSNRGVIPHGEGMTLSPEQAKLIGYGSVSGIEQHIKDYRNGKDIMQIPRGVKVIDLYPLKETEVLSKFPNLYQWLIDNVKPERLLNKDKSLRENWWLHRRNNEDMRRSLAGLKHYVATVQTSKHKIFVFLDGSVLPDDKLIAIALSDAYFLGVLSSRLHIFWSLVSGARLGVGNDPVYNKSMCFDAFPFPDASDAQKAQIRTIAEQIDAHRKRQQAAHPTLTLTNMYNVLEKLRSGEALNAKDKEIHAQALTSILQELHDKLDRAVFAAYGWDDLAAELVGKPGATTPLPDKPEAQAQAEEELLSRLVDLNTQRAAEEAQGTIRWLRPDFQAPASTPLSPRDGMPSQQEDLALADDDTGSLSAAEGNTPAVKRDWPKVLREQTRLVRELLALTPLSAQALSKQFKRKPSNLQEVLDALQDLGMVACEGEVYRMV
ncbi:class I SAM-dependent DNA methyltransferase [Thiothrix litoralis]|uniref:site-specific DNA-methyltransferase (adenine-specific) n=1 Tax=Thiothrix litoralis TaxID=2891210 RepID=A0ABX7WTP6_9GAMM|nr:class I SAM-dependent DNA methyltransferase [Thiothrix litoralis]QTR46656.1 class I SAM-dependent DNA methyltransferase [Thiothrix litoralis]